MTPIVTEGVINFLSPFQAKHLGSTLKQIMTVLCHILLIHY